MHVWLLWCILSRVTWYSMRCAQSHNHLIKIWKLRIIMIITASSKGCLFMSFLSLLQLPVSFSLFQALFSLGMPPQLQDIGSAGISQSIAPRLRSKNQDLGRLRTTTDDYGRLWTTIRSEEEAAKMKNPPWKDFKCFQHFGIIWSSLRRPRTLSAATKPRSR